MEQGTQYHYPGSKYTGPGTHVVSNIMRGIKPTSTTDLVALEHDLDYYVDHEPITSDIKAIYNSDFSAEGVAMKVGLAGRSVADVIWHSSPLSYFGNPTHINEPKKITQDQYNYLLQKGKNLYKHKHD